MLKRHMLIPAIWILVSILLASPASPQLGDIQRDEVSFSDEAVVSVSFGPWEDSCSDFYLTRLIERMRADQNMILLSKHRFVRNATELLDPHRKRRSIDPEQFDFRQNKLVRPRGVLVPYSIPPSAAAPWNGVGNAIIEDFLVNDDLTGSCEHYSPAIAREPRGDFVITWMDGRRGVFDIYVQRCDSSGTPHEPGFRVNDDSGAVWHGYPAVAMHPSGSFVVAWEDEREEPYYDIYAQRYDSAGNPLGGNLKVNDDVGNAHQRFPEIAMNDHGGFVITWEDGRGDRTEIYAQRYDPSGSPVGSNFEVSEVAGYYNHYNPDVAMSQCGNFVIVWESGDIYAQVYDSAGGAVGSNFKVNDDVGSAQWLPEVAINSVGSFAVTWLDARGGNFQVYAQRYDSGGNALGSNFQVSDGSGDTQLPNPSITLDDSGKFVIVWTDYRLENWNIYAQRYDSGGVPQGSNFRVNDDLGSDYQWEPALAVDGTGNFVVTWEDYRHGSSHIYAQRYDCSGATVDSNFKVDCDFGTANQYSPRIAASESNRFVITWTDQRNGHSDIYAQSYDSTGAKAGSNFRVNDDTGGFSPWDSHLAIDARGCFVITWSDYRNGDQDIYAQRYDQGGNPLGPNFRVNDDTGAAYQRGASLDMNALGDFVISWGDSRNGNSDIYAQRYDSAGIALGPNFRVDDGPEHSWAFSSAVTVQSSGGFVIAWSDDRNGDLDIYAQRYSSSGTPLGPNFRVNDDAGSADQPYPEIAVDGVGNFTMVWEDYRNGDGDIYAQRYDSLGTALGSNFRVNDDAGAAIQHLPTIATDPSGGVVVTWGDNRNGRFNPDIYAQRYNSLGDPIYGNYLVTDPAYASFAQTRPAVAANGSRIYFTWTDNRRAKGWDIYANFRQCFMPRPFSLLFPPNKAFTPRGVRFDWEDADDPGIPNQVSYDLYTSTSYYFLPDQTTVDRDITTSQYTKSLDYAIYYWKVKAKNTCGAERWSNQVRHFMVTGIHASPLGDFNGDGSVDIADVVFCINYLFANGHASTPLPAGDVTCDGQVNIADVVYLINYLFAGGPPPCEP